MGFRPPAAPTSRGAGFGRMAGLHVRVGEPRPVERYNRTARMFHVHPTLFAAFLRRKRVDFRISKQYKEKV
jgi:hypothetical protein